MKCLSVRQPWADMLVAFNYKSLEIRSWSTDYRGLLLIHAAASKVDQVDAKRLGIVRTGVRGAVIGVVGLLDVVRLSEDDWEKRQTEHLCSGPRPFGEKTYGWVLRSQQRFSGPVMVRGERGLFEVPDRLVAAELRRLEARRRAFAAFCLAFFDPQYLPLFAVATTLNGSHDV